MNNHSTSITLLSGRFISSLVLLFGVGVVVAGLNALAWPYQLGTWWANFIYMAAALLWLSAGLLWSSSTRSWQLMAQLCLSTGAIVFTLATILLFQAMAWSWPLMVLVPGLALLGHCLALGQTQATLGQQAWLRTVAWGGVMTVLVGLTFWLIQLGLLPISGLIGDFQWWGGITMLAGFGAIWNAVWLYQQTRQRLTLTVTALFVMGLIVSFGGFLEIIYIL